nr:MAG TPA: hypothetical protein [Inoviridae sp.]
MILLYHFLIISLYHKQSNLSIEAWDAGAVFWYSRGRCGLFY